MAAVRVRSLLLHRLPLRNFLCFLKPRFLHTGNRSQGDLPFVKKCLIYLRTNEKYEATTSRTRDAFCPKNKETSASIYEKLGDMTSSSPESPMQRLRNRELILMLRLLSTGQFTGIWSSMRTQQLDSECERRLLLFNAGNCLLVLDIWLSWLGVSATLKLNFCKIVLCKWRRVRDCHEPVYLTQLLFYIGLAKESPEPLMRFIEKCLEGSLEGFTQEDLAIICQGFFKTSTKIRSAKLLAAVSAQIKTMLSTGSVESDFLVCFLKVLRHARYEHPDLCVRLGSFLKDNLCPRETALVVCAHYAAFFANVRYYDRELFCKFEACVLHNFESELAFLARTSCTDSKDFPPSRLSRMKDTARILWAMSEAGHQPECDKFWEVATGYMRQRMKVDRAYLLPRHFIDSLHSLAMVGVFPVDLLDVVPRLNLDRLQGFKTVARQMYTLYQSLIIEHSINKVGLQFVMHEGPIGPSFRCQNMNFVHDLVKHCCGGDGDFYKRRFLLKHVYIEGFEFLLDKDGKLCNMHDTSNYTNCTKVALEVLESTKCMQIECKLPGMYSLKVRQLEKLGYKVAIIFPQDIKQLEGKSTQEKVAWLEAFLKRIVN